MSEPSEQARRWHRLAVAVLTSAVEDYCGRGKGREGQAPAAIASRASAFLFTATDVGTLRWFALAQVDVEKFRERWQQHAHAERKRRMLATWLHELEMRKPVWVRARQARSVEWEAA